jgi:OFA family oxalate/formate antiporter-like MFS transporter
MYMSGSSKSCAAPNRGVIAAAAVLIHMCLGSVYAWSVLVLPMRSQTGWSEQTVTWAFSLAIASLGLTAALLAPHMQRWGPRRCIVLSAILFSTGLLGAGAAIAAGSPLLLYATFGIVGGIGLGFGYVPPVTTLLRWFADRKGLATGLAVGGFGLGATVASFYAPMLVERLGISGTFWALAATYGPVLLACAFLLRLPAAPSVTRQEGGPGRSAAPPLALLLLWGVFFTNIAAGILLIALAKPMLSGSFGFPDSGAFIIVAAMGLSNGFGRLLWSATSDRTGRLLTWAVMLILQSALFLAAALSSSGAIFAASICIIASCYGGGFALCPAIVADLFGSARAPRLYGITLTAWSAAALVGPPLAAWLRARTGSNMHILLLCAGACGAALLLLRALHVVSRPGQVASAAAIGPATEVAGSTPMRP